MAAGAARFRELKDRGAQAELGLKINVPKLELGNEKNEKNFGNNLYV